jgi:hypothetical protein
VPPLNGIVHLSNCADASLLLFLLSKQQLEFLTTRNFAIFPRANNGYRFNRPENSMPLKHILPGVACLALLAGCATTDTHPASKTHASVATAVSEAEVAFNAGMPDKGVKLLKDATLAFPADKQPWLKLAQHQFDNRIYGDAVVSALEVLERDQDEMQAHSIVAVAGLRLSLKALSDLTQKNNLSGTVKSEAQDLAKLLRSRLGEELIAKEVKKQPARNVAATQPKAAQQPKPAAKDSDDPFAGMKN